MYIIYRNALLLIYNACIAQTETSLIQTLILLQQPQKKKKNAWSAIEQFLQQEIIKITMYSYRKH